MLFGVIFGGTHSAVSMQPLRWRVSQVKEGGRKSEGRGRRKGAGNIRLNRPGGNKVGTENKEDATRSKENVPEHRGGRRERGNIWGRAVAIIVTVEISPWSAIWYNL
jgi:hypothetical protein